MYNYPHKTAYRSLADKNFLDYLPALLLSSANSLYLHIPFCETKCGFCNLFSVAGQGNAAMEQYLDAMKRQAAQYQLTEVAFQSLTIGGGTPLLLSADQLERLLLMTYDLVHFQSKKRELIIETSPRQTSRDKFEILKEHGVTRVSIGIQSFHDAELKSLRRGHRVNEALPALELLKQMEIPSLNLDLIYGIPGQTEVSLLDSIRKALFFEPEELFLYPLYQTRDRICLGQGRVNNSDYSYRLYQTALNELKNKGYYQTSMRRFVKKAPVPSENWEGCGFQENTVAIGCGGRSYIGNLHFCEPYDNNSSACIRLLKQYMEKNDHTVLKHGYLLNMDENKRHFILKNLFYINGLSEAAYQKYFHGDLWKDFPVLAWILEKGYAIRTKDHFIKLTQEGMDLSDCLGPMFISEEVKERMEKWQSQSF